jgi:hypothetical protein
MLTPYKSTNLIAQTSMFFRPYRKSRQLGKHNPVREAREQSCSIRSNPGQSEFYMQIYEIYEQKSILFRQKLSTSFEPLILLRGFNYVHRSAKELGCVPLSR